MGRQLRFLAVFILTLVGIYALLVRPRQLRWGASDEEVDHPLPGDEIITAAKYVTTHAVTINAPASAVWPWIVQIGQGRGGFYSHDWLENLANLNIHSADRIIPELQDLKQGGIISLAPDNAMPLTVVTLDPNRALVVRTGMPDSPVQPGAYLRGEIAATWAFILEPIDDRNTRLIVRWRSDWRAGPTASLLNLVMLEPAHFIMERKMLLGIKERAERLATYS